MIQYYLHATKVDWSTISPVLQGYKDQPTGHPKSFTGQKYTLGSPAQRTAFSLPFLYNQMRIYE